MRKHALPGPVGSSLRFERPQVWGSSRSQALAHVIALRSGDRSCKHSAKLTGACPTSARPTAIAPGKRDRPDLALILWAGAWLPPSLRVWSQA